MNMLARSLVLVVTTLVAAVAAPTQEAQACGSYERVDVFETATSARGGAGQLADGALWVTLPKADDSDDATVHGRYFVLVDDARAKRLAKRLARGERPVVKLGRASATDPWRVLSISRA